MYLWLDLFTILAVFGAGLTAGVFYTRRISLTRWDWGDALCVVSWLCAVLSVAFWAARDGLQ